MNNSDKLKLKHTESIRYVMSGAAPLGYKDVEYFLQKAPNSQFIQGYGLTETSPMVTISAIGSKNYASVGNLSRDTEAKIVDVDDEEHLGLGPNMTGELWVKGPQVMSGYHKNEKATRETLINGWLRTGDIGHYDENFEFYITDRLKELIKVKGFQVAPAELEEILRSHTDIDEAAVIGIPHPNFGEVPRAYIVKKKDSNINEEQIKNFVEEKVASFKRLDSVEFLKEIPKTATGKILRRELKSLYQNNKQINL
jgi:4-coumarate--CoA ligase